MKRYIIILGFIIPMCAAAHFDFEVKNTVVFFQDTVLVDSIMVDTLVQEDELVLNYLKTQPHITQSDRYSICLNVGNVFDLSSSELDVDPWSRDMSSGINDKLRFAFSLSLNYQISTDLSFSIDYGSGSIYGKNDIMYYDGQFSQYNLSSNLNLLYVTNKTNLYAKVGVGVIKSSAQRRFFADDIVFLENDNESLKSEIGLGLNHQVSDRWDVNLEAIFNRVDDDGFDTWDDGTGNDKFLSTSIGIKYRLGKPQSEDEKSSDIKALEKLKEIDDCIDCIEVEMRLDSLEKLFHLFNFNNQRLDSLEQSFTLINFNNERLDSLEQSFNFNNESLDSLDQSFTLINFNKESLDSLERSFNLINFNKERIERLEKLNYKRFQNVSKYLPLNLYFHNDEPNPNSLETSTTKTYKEVYLSYYKMKDEYRKYNPNLDTFFEDSLAGNFNKLNIIFSHILSDLKQGKNIQLQIKGHTSPLHGKMYNINLSKRRIKSFINFIELHQGGEFSPYLENGYFQIIELPCGENNADNSVSDNPDDRQKSVFSLDAMLERRIEIIDVLHVQ